MTNISRRGILPNVGYKSPVVVVSTADITLSGSQVIGTVTVLTGDRVLVNAQTDPTENGIYDVNAAGTWVRSQDFNDREDAVNGVQVLDIDSSIVYRAVFTAPFIPGTSTINFVVSLVVPGGAGSTTEVLFNLAGAITSDPNLTWDGTLFDITGDLDVSGNVNSLGATDIATGTRVQIENSVIRLGDASSSYSILMGNDTNFLQITGAGNSGAGGAILLFSGSHPSQADDTSFRAGGNEWLTWDESLGELDILTGIGAKTLAATFDVNQDLNMVGYIGAYAGTPADGEVLTWIAANTRFESTALAAGGITNLGETDMTAASTFDESAWPDNVQWFRVYFRDVNMSSTANDITLRLRDGSGLVTSGYDSHCTDVDSAGTRTFTADTARFTVESANSANLIRGYFEGQRLDETSDIWSVTGKFYDENNDDTFHVYGEIDLASDIDGYRIQSANAANFTAGFLSSMYST